MSSYTDLALKAASVLERRPHDQPLPAFLASLAPSNAAAIKYADFISHMSLGGVESWWSEGLAERDGDYLLDLLDELEPFVQEKHLSALRVQIERTLDLVHTLDEIPYYTNVDGERDLGEEEYWRQRTLDEMQSLSDAFACYDDAINAVAFGIMQLR